MKSRSEVFTHFINLCTEIRTQFNVPVYKPRSDNAIEYMSAAFQTYMTQQGISTSPHMSILLLKMGLLSEIIATYLNQLVLCYLTWKCQRNIALTRFIQLAFSLIACQHRCSMAIPHIKLCFPASLYSLYRPASLGVLAMSVMFDPLLLSWIPKLWSVSFWDILAFRRHIIANFLICEILKCLPMWCSQNIYHSSPRHPLDHLRGRMMNGYFIASSFRVHRQKSHLRVLHPLFLR